MAWYENATIFYDWVRYGEELDRNYPRDVVGKAIDLGVDTLAFCVQAGGYALWDSEVTPKAEFIGGMDLIGQLARLCEENDLHFVPWWLGTALGVERVLRLHPSWQLVGPPMQDGPQRRHNYVCYSSPYRELLYDEIGEVLERYEPDGIYFDQLPGSCYCSWCRAKFEARYGQPMPIVENEFFVYNTAAGLPPKLREFRDDAVRSFCTGVRRIVDRIAPSTCYAQNWVRNQQAYLAADLADVLLPEFYQREDLIPLGLKHRLTKAYFDNGPIWGNVRHSVRHDARHHPVRGTCMLLFDCVANLASPLMLDLCAMDFDPTGKDELAEAFADIRAVQEVRGRTEPVRYAALLHSRRTHELFTGRFDEAFEGMYRLLFENHVPFDVVNEAGVQRGELADYSVLVLPDAVSLADATCSAICEAAAEGMGVVATHMTGWMDPQGRTRETPALADLLGGQFSDVVAYEGRKPEGHDPVLNLPDTETERFFHYGSAMTEHPLAEGIDEATRFSFHGAFTVFEQAGDCRVLGYVHSTDQPRLHGRPYNRPGIYPGPRSLPLAVTREKAGARTAYFGPQADATWRRSDAPELEKLMLRSILWAGGEPPLRAPNCPSSVEVRLFANPEDGLYQVLLVNQTTNPLVRSPGGWGVVRYVTPQKGLVLAIRTDGVARNASSLKGTDVTVEAMEDGWTRLLIPSLDLYDSITIECERR